MSASEQMRIAVMAADRSRRAAISRLLYSPLLRWRFGKAVADQLLIVPLDLRTADPSFWHEVELGQFGLARTIAELRGRSPFAITPPNAGWARALHSFDWLRHLEAASRDEARDIARSLVVEWVGKHRNSPLALEPAVTGRRIISWLSHAGLLLDGADARSYEAITKSLGGQLVRLSADWRYAPEGYPRLVALTALVLADLCIAGHDDRLADAERHLAHELYHQVLGDGGHITRNSAVLVEVMLDLLPLRQCFVSRGRKTPEALTAAIARIPAMLRFMRLGDGTLARFNGVSAAQPAGLATVLAYDDRRDAQPGLAPYSRYARLARGATVLLMDAGPAPPLALSAEAQAGCLSFEMSHGTQPVLVNGGAPGVAEAIWRATARASASHNTLVLGETSSAELVRSRRLEAMMGAPGLKGPANVAAHVGEVDSVLEATASHDGYRDRYGLIHTRRLRLSGDGLRLEGTDSLAGHKVRVRLRQDQPIAVHFHLHPDADGRLVDRNMATIILKNGKTWRLSTATKGIAVSIEDSVYCCDSAGPRTTLQVVLRGTTYGEAEVSWTLEAVT